MKLCIVLLVFTSMAVSGQSWTLQPAVNTFACSSNEYHPGPDCGLEPSCSPRSATFRPKTTCDCWCRPGLYRDPYTNYCVIKCDVTVDENVV